MCFERYLYITSGVSYLHLTLPLSLCCFSWRKQTARVLYLQFLTKTNKQSKLRNRALLFISTLGMIRFSKSQDLFVWKPATLLIVDWHSWKSENESIQQHRIARYCRECTAVHCTVLYCTVLYCTVLYCTVLYCTALHWVIVTVKAGEGVMMRKRKSERKRSEFLVGRTETPTEIWNRSWKKRREETRRDEIWLIIENGNAISTLHS